MSDAVETAMRFTTGPVLEAMDRWLAGEEVPPLREFFERFGRHYRSYRADWHAFESLDFQESMIRTTKVQRERALFIERFGFSVPTAEAVVLLLKHSPLLEVGAGSGSWARLLKSRGADIIATDPSLERFAFQVGTYHSIEKCQGKTAVRHYPDRNVFCSWPSLNKTWLRQAARAMRPGRYLLVVREDATADERTWEYVESEFIQTDDLELPSWHFTHDRLECWRKRARLHGPKRK